MSVIIAGYGDKPTQQTSNSDYEELNQIANTISIISML